MPNEYDLGPAPFSIEDLILKGRNGPLPDGYLNAYLAYLRRSHATAQTEIERTCAEAADGPAESERRRDVRF